jgi:hypothetical protein
LQLTDFRDFGNKPPGFNILQTVTTSKLLILEILSPKYQKHFPAARRRRITA